MKKKSDIRKLRVLIAGTTPYADNRGNSAIFAGTMAFFRTFKDSNFRLSVWHSYPESRQRIAKHAATTNLDFKKIGDNLDVDVIYYKSPDSRFMFSLLSVAKLSFSIVAVSFYRFFGSMHLNVKPRIEIVNELLDSDAVIEFGFGDTLTDVYYGKIIWLYNAMRLTLEFLSKKPVYFFPQSIGPFKSVFSRAIARIMFRNAKLIAVRERSSLKNVLELRVSENKAHLIPDMSFWLPINDDGALKTNEECSLQKLGKKRKVLALMFTESILTKRKSPISLETTTKIIDRLIDELNVDLIFIPHATSFGPFFDSYKFSLLIRAKLENKDHAFVIAREYSVEELWSLLGQCDIAISTLTHPVMSSLRQGIPVLALSYSHKTLGIMRVFNMEKYVLSYDDFGKSNFIEAAKDLLDKSVEIRQSLLTSSVYTKQKMREFRELVKASLLTQSE
jgi:colanic acid/amylovoran biosynthesis protein